MGGRAVRDVDVGDRTLRDDVSRHGSHTCARRLGHRRGAVSHDESLQSEQGARCLDRFPAAFTVTRPGASDGPDRDTDGASSFRARPRSRSATFEASDPGRVHKNKNARADAGIMHCVGTGESPSLPGRKHKDRGYAFVLFVVFPVGLVVFPVGILRLTFILPILVILTGPD